MDLVLTRCIVCSWFGCDESKHDCDKKTMEFIGKAREKQKDKWKYGYEKVKYVNNKIKVIITCPRHGEFVQPPYQHLRPEGCKKCSNNQKGGFLFVKGVSFGQEETFKISPNHRISLFIQE